MPTSSRRQVNEYSRIRDNDAGTDEDGTEFADQNKSHSVKSQSQPSYDSERRSSFASEDEDPLLLEVPSRIEEKENPVTWMGLPRKSQLAILTLARLSEPLVQSGLRVSVPNSFRGQVSHNQPYSPTYSTSLSHLTKASQMEPLPLRPV